MTLQCAWFRPVCGQFLQFPAPAELQMQPAWSCKTFQINPGFSYLSVKILQIAENGYLHTLMLLVSLRPQISLP